jgi:peptidyl-prolyl cis-trans isomerase B (cyclophilin B)
VGIKRNGMGMPIPGTLRPDVGEVGPSAATSLPAAVWGSRFNFRVTRWRACGFFRRTMKRMLFLFGLAWALAGFTSLTAQESKTPAADQVAVLKFKDYGDIVLEFWPDVAPKTVENFKTLAGKKFYDGTQSHRLIKGFMIQLGDPLTKDPNMAARWGTGDPGYKIKAEFNKKPHVKGTVSMARSQDPDSAGSQFFICFGTAPHLDGQYTAFATVLSGMDVLDKLEKVPVGGPQGSRPQNAVVLESVRIIPRSELKSETK